MPNLPALEATERYWKYRLDIKPLLNLMTPDGVTPCRLSGKAGRISLMMLELPCKDQLLCSLLLGLHRAGDNGSKAEFNNVLTEIYDWADRHDVWLGVTPQTGYLDETSLSNN